MLALAQIPREVANRRRSYTTIRLRPVSHHFRVNGAGDAIVKLGVQFRQLIRLVEASLRYVPDGSRFNDVANNKLLNSFVLRDTASTIGTADWIYMATAMLGTSTVSAFASHFEIGRAHV